MSEDARRMQIKKNQKRKKRLLLFFQFFLSNSRGALQIAELERKVGQQTMEIELLKKARARYLEDQKERSSHLFSKGASNGGAR